RLELDAVADGDDAAAHELAGGERHARVDHALAALERHEVAAAFVVLEHARLDDLAEAQRRGQLEVQAGGRDVGGRDAHAPTMAKDLRLRVLGTSESESTESCGIRRSVKRRTWRLSAGAHRITGTRSLESMRSASAASRRRSCSARRGSIASAARSSTWRIDASICCSIAGSSVST